MQAATIASELASCQDAILSTFLQLVAVRAAREVEVEVELELTIEHHVGDYDRAIGSWLVARWVGGQKKEEEEGEGEGEEEEEEEEGGGGEEEEWMHEGLEDYDLHMYIYQKNGKGT